MDRRLILDTFIPIAYERGALDRDSLDDDELAVAAVTVAEYRVGIELADTVACAADRSRTLLAAIVSNIEVLQVHRSHGSPPHRASPCLPSAERPASGQQPGQDARHAVRTARLRSSRYSITRAMGFDPPSSSRAPENPSSPEAYARQRSVSSAAMPVCSERKRIHSGSAARSCAA